MKKTKIKEIKKIAEQFPKSIEEYVHVEIMFGTDFIKRGILQAEGKDIEPSMKYNHREVRIRELNHFNRIKSMIEKGKTIEDYIDWFKRHHDNMIKKFPKLFKNSQNETVKVESK